MAPLSAVLRSLDAERLWWVSSLVLTGLLISTAIVSLFDPRSIGGESVWAKPIKFQLSLALHFATLAIIVRGLSADWRTGKLLLMVAVASVASTIFEISYIMAQAARQQASHFNLSTPFYAAMYVLMASGAVLIIGAAGVVGAIAAVDALSRFGDVLRTGIALGLIGGTVLTLVTAFTLGGRLEHHVGTAAIDAARMPFTGWSLEVGDLRVPHFFATHMIQAVPVVAVLADALVPRTLALAAVWLFAAAWSLATIYFYRAALSGIPFGRFWT